AGVVLARLAGVDAGAAGGAGPVWHGADGAALLAGGPRAARRQPPGSGHAVAAGTAAQTAVGLPGGAGAGNAFAVHAPRRGVHPRRFGLALLAAGEMTRKCRMTNDERSPNDQ